MKIRTDFVTNSSSSSFVTIIVKEKNNKVSKGTISNDNDCIGDFGHHIDLMNFKKKYKNGNDIIKLLAEEIDDAYGVDDAINNDSDIESNLTEIENITSLDDVEEIIIEDEVNCDDGCYLTKLTYNAITNKTTLDEQMPD